MTTKTTVRYANDPRSSFSQLAQHEDEMLRQSEENHRAKNEAAATNAKAAAEVTRQALMRRKGLHG